MGLLVFGALRFVSIDTRCVTAQRGLAQARRLAEWGLALGAHPEVKRGDPLLANEDGNESYFAFITSEEARFNPNALIAAKSQIVLNRLFLVWGLKADQASALTGAMVDWGRSGRWDFAEWRRVRSLCRFRQARTAVEPGLCFLRRDAHGEGNG